MALCVDGHRIGLYSNNNFVLFQLCLYYILFLIILLLILQLLTQHINNKEFS
jgi:hypothetical protein